MGHIRSAERRVLANGYVRLRIGARYVHEHVFVAEQAFGKRLPAGAIVHHHNEVRSDNRNRNLVICEDRQYHKLLHVRMRVKARGGDPNRHRICATCKALKPIDDFYSQPRRRPVAGFSSDCRACSSARAAKWNADNKARRHARCHAAA